MSEIVRRESLAPTGAIVRIDRSTGKALASLRSDALLREASELVNAHVAQVRIDAGHQMATRTALELKGLHSLVTEISGDGDQQGRPGVGASAPGHRGDRGGRQPADPHALHDEAAVIASIAFVAIVIVGVCTAAAEVYRDAREQLERFRQLQQDAAEFRAMRDAGSQLNSLFESSKRTVIDHWRRGL